jgi:large subunit ribosomal protein L25
MPQQVTDTIAAIPRQVGSKGVARKLRRAGRLPVVAYAPGEAQRFLSFEPKNFLMQLRHFGRSHIYQVNVEGQTGFAALIKELQQDPVSRQPLHIDLSIIDMTRPIRVVVPIELIGKPAGLIDGGLLNHVLRRAEVLCLPNQVPAKIDADVTPLKIGESLHLSDLKLPEGVKLTSHHDEAIALVSEPDAAPVEDAAATPAAAAAPAAAAKPADKK